MQSYLLWALLALVGYSLFTPLAEIATKQVPSTVVALVANSMLALSALAVVLLRRENPFAYAGSDVFPHMLAAGVFLSVGILAYYRALSQGPITVVVPIFGLFIVTSSAIGFLFLGDEFSARKGAGILLAAVAIYLTVTG
ncbi:EamA family transporter [Halomarina litorea]|uniref:EamA family transporter n=1 Tax=Halomarina litorea TaxID=2961595 RepID=UPI0020C471AE|nr:EamA family transporter [Halomarina sp. BCD28]